MICPTYRREFHIVTERGLIRWNFKKGIVSIETENKVKNIHKVSKCFTRNKMFLDHLKYFIDRIDNKNLVARCSFFDGIKALEVASMAKKSNLLGKRIRRI
jgi:hypothetical protein